MSLLLDAMEKCAFINAAIVDDGRGSNVTTYTQGNIITCKVSDTRNTYKYTMHFSVQVIEIVIRFL